MSKKLEGYKPQWDPKVFDGPHPDQEFKEINYCVECGEILDEFGDDCMGCYTISPDVMTFYQCSLCLEESEIEECNCYE